MDAPDPHWLRWARPSKAGSGAGQDKECGNRSCSTPQQCMGGPLVTNLDPGEPQAEPQAYFLVGWPEHLPQWVGQADSQSNSIQRPQDSGT